MSSFSTWSASLRRVQHERSPRSLRFFLLVIFALFLFAIYLVWSVGSATVLVGKYTIEKWYTISTLGDKLWFPVASWRYRLWVRFFAPAISIDAGTYETTRATTVSDFVTETLRTPLYIDQTITILPGWSSYDIDGYLANKGIGKIWDFLEISRLNFAQYQGDFSFLNWLKSLEWFLYPDTYRLRQDATTDDAIRIMLREFDRKIWVEYKSLEPRKAYTTLILASIVEREERREANQPIVAGILSKRVNEKIAMWADATVCYGYAKAQKQCTPSFVGSVIRDTNPYNTRSTQGYPPTPIASIAIATWRAALSPESSLYYYYLHDSDGLIHYGRTNDEHNANKQKYLQ